MGHKVLVVAAAVLLFLLLVSSVKASEGIVYLYGTVVSAVDEKNYGPVYVQFIFTVSQTNSSLVALPLPQNVTCIALRSFLNEDSLLIGNAFNFTGQFVQDQPSLDSPPVGYFLISDVSQNVTSQPSWVQTLTTLVTVLMSVGKLLITLIVQGIEAGLGVKLPDWTVAAIVILLLVVSFIKWFRKLPFIVIFIGIIIIVGLSTYMIGPYFGLHV